MTEERPLILFADRSHQWNRGLRAELRRRGLEVLTTTSSSDLVDLVTRFGPQLVVIGEDFAPDPAPLLRTLEYRSPDTAFIVIGAIAEPLPAEGFVHALPGPADAQEVLEWIECLFPSRPTRVLCVDDDPLVLQSIARLLRRHGFVVAAFEDPKRAVDAEADVAILDLRMPGMTGLELADRLKIPVILLSGMTAEADVAAAYRHGAVRFLAKPCPPADLLHALYDLMKSQGVAT